MSWIRKYYLYNQRAHNWRYPKLGQRLWHILVFSALLKLKTPPHFLKLGYMHWTRILFFDLKFTDLTFSRCDFPDDIFISVFMVNVSLSVHKFCPIYILLLHSMQMKASRQSIISMVKDFLNRPAVPGRCNFSSQERTVGLTLDPYMH